MLPRRYQLKPPGEAAQRPSKGPKRYFMDALAALAALALLLLLVLALWLLLFLLLSLLLPFLACLQLSSLTRFPFHDSQVYFWTLF